jgi:hypothetical protein
VNVRCIPLVPAAYGTRVARPARTTLLPPGGDGSQPGRRVRLVPGDPWIVGKSPDGSRQLGDRGSSYPGRLGCSAFSYCHVPVVSSVDIA